MFTHLHAHSWFSMGEGVSSPEALAAAAVRRGFGALACTDSNGVYGAVEFQQAAEAHGLRPILGAQLVHGGQEAVALASDERGWAALCRAITAIHWADGTADGQTVERSDGQEEEQANGRSGRRATRRSDRRTVGPSDLATLLASDRDGLLILSRDAALLERVADLSGTRDLYAELRPGKERHAVGRAARRLGIAPVVTNAAMFANPEEHALHRLRVAIAHNASISSLTSRVAEPTAWLRPASDLARHFPDCPEAIGRSMELAERCEYRIPIGQRTVAPRIAAAEESLARLRALAYEGAARRYGTVAPLTRDRLEHELAIIAQKHFADYFLVVHDIVLHGPTHCGRGSVANSIVSYCLGITHVDPLGAGLLFERFLNPERRDPPDIDLDFPWDERDQVLAWVFRKYPRPRAAMVANHNCFRRPPAAPRACSACRPCRPAAAGRCCSCGSTPASCGICRRATARTGRCWWTSGAPSPRSSRPSPSTCATRGCGSTAIRERPPPGPRPASRSSRPTPATSSSCAWTWASPASCRATRSR